MVEEGKIVQNKENSTPSVLQLNDTKVMSHNSDVIQNLFQQLLVKSCLIYYFKWRKSTNEWEWNYLQKAQNGTYIEKNRHESAI